MILPIVALVLGAPLSLFDQGVQAFNEDRWADAAGIFDQVLRDPATKEELKVKATYYRPRSLHSAGLAYTAASLFAPILSNENHPYFLKAIAELANIAETERDAIWIPSLVDEHYSKNFSRANAPLLNAINFMCGLSALRRGLVEEARPFLSSLQATSPVRKQADLILKSLSSAQRTGSIEQETRRHQVAIEAERAKLESLPAKLRADAAKALDAQVAARKTLAAGAKIPWDQSWAWPH